MAVVEIREEDLKLFEKPKTYIKSDKFKHEFVVTKTEDGYIFYGVKVTKGNVPKELQGHYNSMKAAVQAVIEYERRAKPTATVRRDKNAEERAERKMEVFNEE